MYLESKEKNFYSYIVFLIWPILSVWLAFKNYQYPWAKNIIWIFIAFYAYTMVISDTGADANRYRDQFVEMAGKDRISFEMLNLYNGDKNINLDVLKPFLNVVVSRFTDNYKVLFLIYGLIFGYFFSRNLWLLIDNLNHPLTYFSIFLLVIYVLINPIWNINGFRMWTAALIFVNGVFLYFFEGKKKGIFIALTSIFVHFSFIIPNAIFFFYLVIGNHVNIYFYFFIFSLFVNEVDLGKIRDNSAFIPAIFQQKVDAYTDENYKESKSLKVSNSNWYVKWFGKARNYSIYFYLIILYWKCRKEVRKNKSIYKLFGFSLLFLTFANVFNSIPSMGRFIVVSLNFSLAVIILSIDILKNRRPFKYAILITLPALLLFIIVSVRIGFYTISITTILGNPIIALFMEGDMALDNLIK